MAKTTEELVAEAKKAGVKATLVQRPKGSGEIVLLPGVRKKREQ